MRVGRVVVYKNVQIAVVKEVNGSLGENALGRQRLLVVILREIELLAQICEANQGRARQVLLNKLFPAFSKTSFVNYLVKRNHFIENIPETIKWCVSYRRMMFWVGLSSVTLASKIHEIRRSLPLP